MNTSDLGHLERTPEGRCRLTFEREFPHRRDKVWRAITEPGHLRGWFAQHLDYERSQLPLSVEGAELVFWPAPGQGQLPVETGRVVRCVQPSLLEYSWGDETLRWELEPTGDGGCRLTLSNYFDDPSFAPFNGVGWHTGLLRLAAVLAGADPTGIQLETDEQAAHDLLARYEQAFA